MFEGFQIQDVVLPHVTLRVRSGGLGSPHALPLLLLHGRPQSHTRVAGQRLQQPQQVL